MTDLAGPLDSATQSEVIDLLRDLVQIRSYNPPGEEAAVGRRVADWLAGAGLDVTTQAVAGDRANVIGRMAGTGERPALMLCAHLDTVPAGGVPWAHDPLSGRLADGRVYGRGSADTKGALAAMMVAARRVLRSGRPLRGGLIVLATVDEETNGLGARAFLESGGMAGVGAAVIGEPTSLDLVIAHRGAFWLEIVTRGKAAHGAMPERGVNAILPMAALLHQIAGQAFSYAPDALLRPPSINVGTIEGGTKINMVPDHCRASVDIRTVPGQSHAALLEEAQRLGDAVAAQWPGLSVELRAINDKPPLATPADDPFVAAAQAVAQDVLGRPPRLRGAPYLTDGSLLAGSTRTPAVICGPGEEGIAHQVDEAVAVDEVCAAVRLYAGLAARLLT